MPKRTLTVLLVGTKLGVLGSGIIEDADIFRNVPFDSYTEALHYLKRYNTDFNVVLNIPNNIRRKP